MKLVQVLSGSKSLSYSIVSKESEGHVSQKM